MLELVHELDIHAEVAPDDVGPGPFGHRRIATIIGGSARGPRLSGTITGAGADWILRGPDGFGRVDARLTITTDDGANIYVQYFGLLELTSAVVKVMSGGEEDTAYGDQYFITGPRFETGDGRYDWLNTGMFVAEGRLLRGPAVAYQVFRVVSS
jgi:hypothetical protein